MKTQKIIRGAATSLPLLLAAAMDSPASQPASSQPAVDRSTPEKTWAALVAAAGAGDRQAFSACCYNHNEISKLFIEAYCDTLITTHQLAAAVATLGDEGKVLSKSFEASFNDLTKMSQNRKADIDGDTLLWLQADPAVKITGQRILYFRKVDDQWLLDSNRSYAMDTAEGRKVAEDFLSSTAPQLKILKTVTSDIQSKKITTLDQMRERLNILTK